MKILALTLLIVLAPTQASGLDVILEWDANTEVDLDHYTLYEATKLGRASGPWTKVADIPKESTRYIRTVPDQGNFTWTVTATDEAGNQSFVSNTVDRYDNAPPDATENLRRVTK